MRSLDFVLASSSSAFCLEPRGGKMASLEDFESSWGGGLFQSQSLRVYESWSLAGQAG